MSLGARAGRARSDFGPARPVALRCYDRAVVTRDLVDLSHVVESGMVTYRGLPAPVISDFLSREASRANYAPGTEFHIARIEMVANTGTYLDTPSHRYREGADLSAISLETIADIDGVVIRRRRQDSRPIGADAFAGATLEGKAVIIHTGWDRHWRTDEYSTGLHPFLSEEGARRIVEGGARLVGIDSYNIDDTADLRRPAHTHLLAAGINIVEHMTNLSALPDDGFRFFAVPVKIKGMGTFPVRAFAIRENRSR